MKELPILFSAPMVRAILEGRKTQTRRVVKWPVYSTSDGSKRRVFLERDSEELDKRLRGTWKHPCDSPVVPFGVPGDRLWVRESLYLDLDRGWGYADGKTMRCPPDRVGEMTAWLRDRRPKQRSCPSIHMPRWASRLTLEVVGVRVERLQAITEDDARAEGVEKNTGEGHKWSPDDGYRTYCSHYPNGCECFPHENARDAYADLWDKINGEGSWDANPWVWVVEFGVVKPGTAGGS